jgi:translation initiation factor IF-2
MPREAGRPREIELPTPPRRGAPGSDATTIEKPVRTQRPVVSREQVEDDDSRKRGPGGAKVPRPAVKTNDEGRQRQKLTITNFDREAQVRSLASLKRKREKEKLKAMGIQQPREKIAREVVIPEAITIQELSNRMAERAVDLIKYLMQQGAMHKITDVLDADTAELIVQ